MNWGNLFFNGALGEPDASLLEGMVKLHETAANNSLVVAESLAELITVVKKLQDRVINIENILRQKGIAQ